MGEKKNFPKILKGVRLLALLLLLLLFCQLTGCGSQGASLSAFATAPDRGDASAVLSVPEDGLPDREADETAAAGRPAAGAVTQGDVFTAEALSAPFAAVFLNVGQADACLLACGGQTLLIDGGNVADSRLLVACLKQLGVSRLDYVVCTHAHEDHVGGLAGPLNLWPAGRVFAPEASADSEAYQNFLKAVAAQELTLEHPVPGDSFSLGEARVTFLGPAADFDQDLNNTSLVLRVDYGETGLLFTGDAERASELALLESGADLGADLLKVGHHGSDTSSSYVFLREVMPAYAVISVEEDNSYGHPHEEVLSRLADAGAAVLRTDQQGAILAVSDGQTLCFTVEKGGSAFPGDPAALPSEAGAEASSALRYIGNQNSRVFHSLDCANLPAEKNQIFFSSREEATEAGYRPCGNCNP